MSHNADKRPILVLGAFGVFGRRIVDALARTTDLGLVVAGRRVDASFAAFGDRVTACTLDKNTLNLEQLTAINPSVVIDTVGPFQTQDYTLARYCIQLGIHFIDLSDDAASLKGITQYAAFAKQQKVLVVGGASTVPALSSAVIEHLMSAFSIADKIDIGIAPGYDAPRGLATIRSILGYVGHRIPVWRLGCIDIAYGWSDMTLYRYPLPVGVRHLSLVDVPDTAFIPALYPSLQQLTIRAGIEIALVHRMLGWLGHLVRLGAIRNLKAYARILQRLSKWFDRLGSDNGAMHVAVFGSDFAGRTQSRCWTLVAEHGDGPQIPATAAVLLTKKLLAVPGYAPLMVRGAMPAIGLLSLQEFEREWRSLAIHTTITSGEMPIKVSSRRAP